MHITAPNVAVVVYRTSRLVKFNAVTGRGSSQAESALTCCSVLLFSSSEGEEILIRGVAFRGGRIRGILERRKIERLSAGHGPASSVCNVKFWLSTKENRKHGFRVARNR